MELHVRGILFYVWFAVNYVAAFEEKQMRLKALRNRQDLFQEEVTIVKIHFFVASWLLLPIITFIHLSAY